MTAPGPFATIDDLFGATRAAADTEVVTLPSTGRRVRVRGLTRHELLANGKDGADALTVEARNLAATLVDPVLTVDQAAQWQRAAPAGELAPVVTAIRRLTGLDEGAAKSDLPADGDD